MIADDGSQVMFEELNDLYQQVIMDHSKKPHNFGMLAGANCCARGQNPLCGDQMQIYLKTENNIVQDLRWEGDGCAIFKASSSLMTDSLKGKTREEVKQLFEEFHALITTGKIAPNHHLGKLEVLSGVNRFPARVKCALLGWRAAMSALEGDQQPVSTE